MRFAITQRSRAARHGRPSHFAVNVSILVCLLNFVPFAIAQGVSGRIVGTVVDQSNAAVSKATLTVTNQDTASKSQVLTNSRGEYRIKSRWRLRAFAPSSPKEIL